MRKSAAALAAAIVLALSASPVPAPAQQDTYSVVSPYVVTVVTISGGTLSLGSGVVLQRGTVLTAAHVIPAQRESVWVGRQGQVSTSSMRRARPLLIDRDADVALLDAGLPAPGLQMVEYPVSSGEELWAFGYEYHRTGNQTVAVLRMARASVGQRWRDYFQVDGAFQRGFSGGPLVTRGGKVAGILSFAYPGNTSLAYMVPAHWIEARISRAPIPQTPTTQAQTPVILDHSIVPGLQLGPVYVMTQTIRELVGRLGTCHSTWEGSDARYCRWNLPPSTYRNADGGAASLIVAHEQTGEIIAAYTDATAFSTSKGNRTGMPVLRWLEEFGTRFERSQENPQDPPTLWWWHLGIAVNYRTPDTTVTNVFVFPPVRR